ncbi:MAG: hypothetical protein KF851_14355 [Pirellulaceae bacterium]|nr:hypothetical protein [Pirellulaceae bacterium]
MRNDSMAQRPRRTAVPDDWFGETSPSEIEPSDAPAPTVETQGLKAERKRGLFGRFVRWSLGLLVPAERIRLVLLMVVLLASPAIVEILEHVLVSMLHLFNDDVWLSIVLSFSLPICCLAVGALILNQMQKSERIALAVALAGSLMLWGVFMKPKLWPTTAESTNSIVIHVLVMGVSATAIVVWLLRGWVARFSDAIQSGRVKPYQQWLGAAVMMLVAYSANLMFNSSDGIANSRLPFFDWPGLVWPLLGLCIVPGIVLMRMIRSWLIRMCWVFSLTVCWVAIFAICYVGYSRTVSHLFIVPAVFGVSWFLATNLVFCGNRIDKKELGKDWGWIWAFGWTSPLLIGLVGLTGITYRYHVPTLCMGYMMRNIDWETARELKQWERWARVAYQPVGGGKLAVSFVFSGADSQDQIGFAEGSRLDAQKVSLMRVKPQLNFDSLPLSEASELRITASTITLAQLAKAPCDQLILSDTELIEAGVTSADNQLYFRELTAFDTPPGTIAKLIACHKDISVVDKVSVNFSQLNEADWVHLCRLPRVRMGMFGSEADFEALFERATWLGAMKDRAGDNSLLFFMRQAEFPFGGRQKDWIGLVLRYRVGIQTLSISSLNEESDALEAEDIQMYWDFRFATLQRAEVWLPENLWRFLKPSGNIQDAHWQYAETDGGPLDCLYLTRGELLGLIPQDVADGIQTLAIDESWISNEVGRGTKHPVDPLHLLKIHEQLAFPNLQRLHLPAVIFLRKKTDGQIPGFEFLTMFPNLEILEIGFGALVQSPALQKSFREELSKQRQLKTLIVYGGVSKGLLDTLAELPAFTDLWIVADAKTKISLGEIQELLPKANVRVLPPDSPELIPDHFRRHREQTINRLIEKYPDPLELLEAKSRGNRDE